nr:hypothetical protein JMPHXYHW_JMPHXYHW_CDS_0016 [uncultured phage]
MTWEIFLGIVALTGFVITIGKIVSANTKAMQKLKDSILELNKTITEEKKDLHDLDEVVQNHETRITLLERN